MTVLQRNIACDPLWALLRDARAWDATLWKRLKGDVLYLESRVMTRGCRELLVSLPNAGKHFDRCLSQGFLTLDGYPEELPTSFGFPQIFRELYDRVFDFTYSDTHFDDGRTYAILMDPCPNAIFFLRTFLYMYKKVEVACPKEALSKSVEDFMWDDIGLRIPTHVWDSNHEFFRCSLYENSRLKFLDIVGSRKDFTPIDTENTKLHYAIKCLDQVCSILWSSTPILKPEDIIPRHGPGAVADLPGWKDKYTLPTWPDKMEIVFPADQYAFSSEEIAGSYDCEKDNLEAFGRLTAVPKTYSGPRLITVEPTSHQFLQQGLMQWLRRNMPRALRHCIDFKSQVPNQELAKESSIDLKSCTVDLSKASDRLSLWTVERAIQSPTLLEALYCTRTICVTDGTGVMNFKELLLKKFAGQGSAVTFPVQSIIYASCCITAVLVSERRKPTKRSIASAAKRVRVFGDDLILPTTALQSLGLILEFLQLKINDDKTHHIGAFRESCGGDYFRGADVTPFYLRYLCQEDKPSVLDSHVDVSNNAHEKGLWHLAKFIAEELFPKEKKRFLAISNVPQACLTLRTFSTGSKAHQSGTHPDWQAPMYTGILSSPVRKSYQREGIHDLLSFFLEKPQQFGDKPQEMLQRPWSSGYSCSEPTKHRITRVQLREG